MGQSPVLSNDTWSDLPWIAPFRTPWPWWGCCPRKIGTGLSSVSFFSLSPSLSLGGCCGSGGTGQDHSVVVPEKALEGVPKRMHRSTLYNELTRSQCTDLPLRFRGTVSCHNNDRLSTVHTANLFQDFDPTHPRHIHIKHNDIGMFPAILLKARPPIVSKEHIIAQRLKNYRDERSDVFRIVNDQNLRQDVPPGLLCGIW